MGTQPDELLISAVFTRNADFPAAAHAKMQGPRPPDDFIGNGCSYVPECLPAFGPPRLVQVTLACHYHDWHYRLGQTEADRQQYDLYFYHNMVTLGAHPRAAAVYYNGARLLGVKPFAYYPPLPWYRQFQFWLANAPMWLYGVLFGRPYTAVLRRYCRWKEAA